MVEPLIHGLILAGGQGRRMGKRDKGLVVYRGKPLIEHLIECLEPQVPQILISANRNLARYQAYGYPVICDTLPQFQGPLAGLLSAMQQTTAECLLVVPCDMPLLPHNLLKRLWLAWQAQAGDWVVAHDGKRLQPLVALMPVGLQEELRQFIAQGQRRLHAWCDQHRLAIADFSDQRECFQNFNHLQELD